MTFSSPVWKREIQSVIFRIPFATVADVRGIFSSLRKLKANSHRHTRQNKTAAPASRPPPWRGTGRQLRLTPRPPTHNDVVPKYIYGQRAGHIYRGLLWLYATKSKHAVDCCIWLNLNFFTKRQATKVIYRLTVQTLPDGLETQFTPPDTTQTGPSCRVWRAVWIW